MCVMCNTVSSGNGWGGVNWVDLATVRPISSSLVWNGSLATVTCKAQSSTETYISGLRGFHLACTTNTNTTSSPLAHESCQQLCGKKILLWQGRATNPRQLPPQLPSTIYWLASRELFTFAFTRCPLEQTFNLGFCWCCSFIFSQFENHSQLPYINMQKKAAC